MFGYVMPVKSELKVREFDAYRAYYCGTCKQLQKSYGFGVRFLLNYDLVLLALVADSLSGQQGQCKKEGCFANPFSGRSTRHGTSGLQLAADGLVMLSYHKLCDNLADEKLLKRLGYSFAKPYLSFKYKQAAARRPAIAAALTVQMQRQQQLEQSGCRSIDEACDPTAKMCKALFTAAGQAPEEQKILGRLGLFAGQIVYLLDAAEDYTDDQKQGRYNVFLQAGYSFEEAVETAKKRCRMAAGELALCYNLLTPKQNKGILDNIFFLGLPAGIAAAGTPKTGGNRHGQINSV